MNKETYGLGIEIESDSVEFLSHEISYFEGRVFKILIIEDHINPDTYDGSYKIFQLITHQEGVGGTSYEIQKILKE